MKTPIFRKQTKNLTMNLSIFLTHDPKPTGLDTRNDLFTVNFWVLRRRSDDRSCCWGLFIPLSLSGVLCLGFPLKRMLRENGLPFVLAFLRWGWGFDAEGVVHPEISPVVTTSSGFVWRVVAGLSTWHTDSIQHSGEHGEEQLAVGDGSLTRAKLLEVPQPLSLMA